MRNRAACTVAVVLVSFLCLVQAREDEGEHYPRDEQAPGASRALSALSKTEELLSAAGVTVIGRDVQAGQEAYPLTRTTLEVRIRWDAVPASEQTSPGAGQGNSSSAFIPLERRQIGEKYASHRSRELSSDHILVAGVDAQGQLRSWTVVPDPRVIRAETPGPMGELSGRVLHRSQPEFLVALPDDPDVTELRFYHPRWTGEEFVLEALGSAPIR
jgi:hypothetical protein